MLKTSKPTQEPAQSGEGVNKVLQPAQSVRLKASIMCVCVRAYVRACMHVYMSFWCYTSSPAPMIRTGIKNISNPLNNGGILQTDRSTCLFLSSRAC